jgi:hypothetical protein
VPNLSHCYQYRYLLRREASNTSGCNWGKIHVVYIRHVFIAANIILEVNWNCLYGLSCSRFRCYVSAFTDIKGLYPTREAILRNKFWFEQKFNDSAAYLKPETSRIIVLVRVMWPCGRSVYIVDVTDPEPTLFVYNSYLRHCLGGLGITSAGRFRRPLLLTNWYF